MEVIESTFQHFNTVAKNGNGLFLFSRQLDGKSVAIKITDIQPHFCIKYPPKLRIKGLEAARRDYAPLLVETKKKMLNIFAIEPVEEPEELKL